MSKRDLVSGIVMYVGDHEWGRGVILDCGTRDHAVRIFAGREILRHLGQHLYRDVTLEVVDREVVRVASVTIDDASSVSP